MDTPALTLTVETTPKMLRETLCAAQTALGNIYLDCCRQCREARDPITSHINRLQQLIDECDRHRPLGPDGKHGNLHTMTCGCEDNPMIDEDAYATLLLQLLVNDHFLTPNDAYATICTVRDRHPDLFHNHLPAELAEKIATDHTLSEE